MRWFSRLREQISGFWLLIKLSVLLSQFLVWFGVNQYLLGRVFLVSACWLGLALLLVTNQVLAARLPNITAPDLKALDISPVLQEKVAWKLFSLPELEKICAALDDASEQHPTHQSLLRNVAFCKLAQGQSSPAQDTWKQAHKLNPNQ